jgi:putative transcription factor
MCGREGPTNRAIVEGSMVNVCSRCSKFGNVIDVTPPKVDETKLLRKPIKPVVPVKKPEPSILIVVPDYAAKVRAAREKALLSQEELAKAIAEKESVIQKVESSQFEPPFSLARKLELFLKVELLKELKPDDSKPKKLDFKGNSLTIGDLIRFRKS